MKPVGVGRKISGLPIPNLIVYKGKRRMVRMIVKAKLMPIKAPNPVSLCML